MKKHLYILIAFFAFAAVALPSAVEAREYFGSVATAIDDDHVAAGISNNYPSWEEADEAAMEQCAGADGQSCQIVGRFWNGGCGAVATGTGLLGNVSWGFSATAQGAINQCTSNGAFCRLAGAYCTSRSDNN